MKQLAETSTEIRRRRLLWSGVATLGVGTMLASLIARLAAATAPGAAKPFQIRRVVTGHDPDGRAVVLIDELAKNRTSGRPGASSYVVWTTDASPADNSGDFDGAERKVGTTLANGTVFRIVEFAPGVVPRRHRTNSIDYAVVMSGEIDMQLDGTEVHLKAGDVLVQRGTLHNWVNRGSDPCVIAFALVDAKPVVAGSKVLSPAEEN